eukprot:CAMPEP_0174384710 /NCGR_PEP_ID=MMETSP0811_2-20130205/126097_1 /TAXON_ID=73025 ORGANISM="Eutreptiella gymnastica-like, Strain CCMP1594" /NCGR_SAMPLE_ID=MMETSP0811_2 /ASSEMBLY_ACC=CAM_ASM_000667 /LENGTH=42 /DNA_ID= /DNA_START= /DNA_END= /DNA_ORIENTATION=
MSAGNSVRWQRPEQPNVGQTAVRPANWQPSTALCQLPFQAPT